MVGLDLLPNAVSLNSVLMNSARVIGPAIGGVLILTVGVGTCFFLNAGVLRRRDRRARHDARRRAVPPARRASGPRDRSARGCATCGPPRTCKVPLLSMAIVGVFAFNFTVTLPLLAKFTFHGGAGLYSLFLAAMGAGAVVGGLATAFRSRPSTRLLAGIGVVFGCAILGVALVTHARRSPSCCSSRWAPPASRSSPRTTPRCSSGPTPPCAAV